MTISVQTPKWTWIWPLIGLGLLLALSFLDTGLVLTALSGLVIFGVVFAAVYHAEVIAHKVGEPFGTLVLALSVTVIEAALIVSLMLLGPEKAALARDTVFATVMIICNGLVGICLLVGGLRHHEQGFQLQGALAALAVLIALTVLILVLPNYTIGTDGPSYSQPQLIFAGVSSLVLYGAFIFIQTVRHRDYFLPVVNASDEDAHAEPPSGKTALISLGLLAVSLVVVVGLAKAISPAIEEGVLRSGAPLSTVGIIVALIVLLPESVAALRAAKANRLQTAMNLALGSSLATIGLTIPVVVLIAVVLDKNLILGLGPMETVLLGLTLLVSMITIGTGRTTVLQGVVHLVIFATFLFMTIVP